MGRNCRTTQIAYFPKYEERLLQRRKSAVSAWKSPNGDIPDVAYFFRYISTQKFGILTIIYV